MFIPSSLSIYFDYITVMVFTMFLLINSFIILFSHYLQQRAVEMQINAQSFGRWDKVSGALTKNSAYNSTDGAMNNGEGP